MKVARFRDGAEAGEGVGIVVMHDGKQKLLDARLAMDRAGREAPQTMLELIGAGRRGLDRLQSLIDWFTAEQDQGCVKPLETIHWLTPVPPRSFIAAGRNFGKHQLESIKGNPAAGAGFHADFPTGFVKLGRVLVPHMAEVRRPPDVKQMDYEVEIAVVVGQAIERASPAQARDAIFGYTVFNDLSAREWQLAEMRNQLVMQGKNFPGFGPVGPWILTADEVPDPAQLELKLEVNGEIRQHDNCQDLIFGFDELLAFWSRTGLEPGDLIGSGTPEGVALRRQPDPEPFFLKPGDVVRASVEQIGVLETRIVG